eukprot:4060495-Amphidinium_carterae.1
MHCTNYQREVCCFTISHKKMWDGIPIFGRGLVQRWRTFGEACGSTLGVDCGLTVGDAFGAAFGDGFGAACSAAKPLTP